MLQFILINCIFVIVSAGLHDGIDEHYVNNYYHAAPQLDVQKYAEIVPTIPKYVAPVAVKTIETEHHAPAKYEFEYSVHDPHTGDAKTQKEVRNGHQVHGSYSLIEADGSKRTVEYTADEHHGFNAVVHREPSAHPVPAKHIEKVVVPVQAKEVPHLAYDDAYSHYPEYYHHH